MDEYAEDLRGAELPGWVERYLVGERQWHRLLRGTGLVSLEEAREHLARWLEA